MGRFQAWFRGGGDVEGVEEDRLRALVVAGRQALAYGRAQDAALLFGRAILADPADTAAREGLNEAAVAERETERSFHAQPAAVLDEDTPGALAVAASDSAERALPPRRTQDWARRAFLASCAIALTGAGLGTLWNWQRLIDRLARPPAPASQGAPRLGDAKARAAQGERP